MGNFWVHVWMCVLIGYFQGTAWKFVEYNLGFSWVSQTRIHSHCGNKKPFGGQEFRVNHLIPNNSPIGGIYPEAFINMSDGCRAPYGTYFKFRIK